MHTENKYEHYGNYHQDNSRQYPWIGTKKVLEQDKASLIEWLNDKFPVSGFLPYTDNQALKAHFKSVFDVNVDIEGDLYIFKYRNFTDKWNMKITRQSRGIIVQCGSDKWIISSRPFEKFYSIHEPQCILSKKDKFEEFYDELTISEKIDGTCIQLWYDTMIDEWRVSTLGKITTTNVGEHDITFEDLFWKYIDKDKLEEHIINTDLQDITFIFEIACKENRIISKYNQSGLYLIAARDKITGSYYDIDDLKEMTEKLGTIPIIMSSLKDIGIKTLHDLIIFVENAKNPEYGTNPEGFVVAYKGFPIAKLKNKNYRDLFKKRNNKLTHNNIIHMIFRNELTNADSLPNKIHEWISEINEWKVQEIDSILQIVDTISIDEKPKRSKFASSIKFVNKTWHPFFFENFDNIYSMLVDYNYIDRWLNNHYDRFIDRIKTETHVPEMNAK